MRWSIGSALLTACVIHGGRDRLAENGDSFKNWRERVDDSTRGARIGGRQWASLVETRCPFWGDSRTREWQLSEFVCRQHRNLA